MKRLIIALLFTGVSAAVYGAPTYSGAEGYIAVPRVDVAQAGRFGLSFKYSSAGVLTPAINVVPLKNFEIGAGWDLNTYPGYSNPILLNAKFQFAKQAAFGLDMELPTDGAGQFAATVFLAWEEKLSASGIIDSSATFLLGYTFDRSSNINFAVGIQRNLFLPMLYLIADFSNFPYRHPSLSGGSLWHQNESRAIFNAGLRLVLADWISFDACGLDLLDSGQRGFMIGANLYVSLWRGGNR